MTARTFPKLRSITLELTPDRNSGFALYMETEDKGVHWSQRGIVNPLRLLDKCLRGAHEDFPVIIPSVLPAFTLVVPSNFYNALPRSDELLTSGTVKEIEKKLDMALDSSLDANGKVQHSHRGEAEVSFYHVQPEALLHALTPLFKKLGLVQQARSVAKQQRRKPSAKPRTEPTS